MGTFVVEPEGAYHIVSVVRGKQVDFRSIFELFEEMQTLIAEDILPLAVNQHVQIKATPDLLPDVVQISPQALRNPLGEREAEAVRFLAQKRIVGHNRVVILGQNGRLKQVLHLVRRNASAFVLDDDLKKKFAFFISLRSLDNSDGDVATLLRLPD